MVGFILALKKGFGIKKFSVVLFIFLFVCQLNAQNSEVQRRRTLKYAYAGTYVASTIGFYQLWYKDYEQSSFHFFNDNKQWLQMDKLGHAYSTYTLTKLSSKTFQWAKFNKQQSALYASAASFTFLTTIELMDAYSKKWGFSWGDFIANSVGVSFYLLQELAFKKQSIILKYSYSPSPYRELRTDALGQSQLQALFKDYNAQTYWASLNINDFIPAFNPKWLNLAVGYSGNQMINAKGAFRSSSGVIYNPQRQYFLSLDVNLEKIESNKKWVKSALSVLNCLKIPFPAVEFTKENRPQLHWLYY